MIEIHAALLGFYLEIFVSLLSVFEQIDVNKLVPKTGFSLSVSKKRLSRLHGICAKSMQILILKVPHYATSNEPMLSNNNVSLVCQLTPQK